MKYDFYYSAKHEAHMRRIDSVMGKDYVQTYVNGKKYTEMTRHGKKPTVTAFDDVKFVCTDTQDKITYV